MTNLRIKELRVQNKLTQEAVANCLRVDRSTFARYEKGERIMSYEAIASLAKFFQVSIAYLLGVEESSPILSTAETELLHKFRTLDGRGQKAVQATIEHEYFHKGTTT
jgi:transcriptional regulator with XRE-family HTH domain